MARCLPALRISLLGGLLLALAPAAAGERRPESMAAHSRLAPVEAAPGPLAAYEADLRRVFRDAFSPDVRLRALVRPSFETEYAVGLRGAKGGYEIFALRPSRQQVWFYQLIKLYRSGRAGVMHVDIMDPKSVPRDESGEELARLEKDLPPDPGDLPLARCATPIDDGLAANLIGAWRSMLEAVQPDEELMPGVDGTTYVFSMESDGRALAGETWTPQEGTPPAKLAHLAETMLGYCQAKEPKLLGEIRALGRELAAARSG